MLGATAQIIALVAHGNEVLRNGAGPSDPDFYPSNSTFKFCEYVRFVEARQGTRPGMPEIWASDPIEWFARLKQEGVHALRLQYVASGGKQIGASHVPDRMLAGFVGGGGGWFLETIGPQGSDFWQPRWEVGDRTRDDRRIWRVNYGRILENQETAPTMAEDLNSLTRYLGETLDQISALARAQKLDNFAVLFEKSKEQLATDAQINSVYHSDVVPKGSLSPVASRLLAAAQGAWVFGGMGSWNDVGIEESAQADYQRLSEALFQLLNLTYVATANATMREAIRPMRKP